MCIEGFVENFFHKALLVFEILSFEVDFFAVQNISFLLDTSLVVNFTVFLL
jgi:hypothetical protein